MAVVGDFQKKWIGVFSALGALAFSVYFLFQSYDPLFRVEAILVERYAISWLVSMFLSRLMFSIPFVLLALALMLSRKKFILVYGIAVLFFVCDSLLLKLDKYPVFDFTLFSQVFDGTFHFLVYLVLVFLVNYFGFTLSRIGNIVLLLVAIASSTVLFVRKPVYSTDLSCENSELFDLPRVQDFPIEVRKQLPANLKQVYFFSTGCSECFKLVHRLSVNLKGQDTEGIYSMYFGTPEGLEQMLESSKLNLPYFLTEDSQLFFPLSGPSVPSVVNYENNMPTQRWVGDNASCSCLDEWFNN